MMMVSGASRRIRVAISLLFLSLLLLESPLAHAGGSQASTVVITASIPPSCTIGAGAIVFAPYDPVNTHATNPNDQTGDIMIRCTKGATGIMVGLGNGANNAGSQRRMVNTADASTMLNYEIYQESNRVSVWGPGDGGALRAGVDLQGTGANVTVTMYGRIPPRQLQATAGTYNDTLVSTILF